jgi:hypothetical protein
MSARVLNVSEQDLKRIVMVINQLAQGRSNAVGTFTLTAAAASTVVTAPACGSESTVLYMPTTANASAEIGAGTIYIGTVANGSFTVTHANNAQVDRTYRYVCIG